MAVACRLTRVQRELSQAEISQREGLPERGCRLQVLDYRRSAIEREPRSTSRGHGTRRVTRTDLGLVTGSTRRL